MQLKLEIEKLGRIGYADIDVKPLTVFIGKTNTNKTWSAYSLYGILRGLSYTLAGRRLINDSVYPKCGKLEEAIQRIAHRTALLIYTNSRKAFSDLPEEENAFVSVEVTRESILQEAKLGQDVTFELDGDSIGKILAFESSTFELSTAKLTFNKNDFFLKGKIKSLRFDIDKSAMTIFSILNDNSSRLTSIQYRGIESQSTENLEFHIVPMLRWLACAIFEESLSFPAERKALTSVAQIIDRMPTREGRGTLFNIPCYDFIRFFSFAQKHTPIRSQVNSIAELLESKVLNGKAEFVGPVENRKFSFSSDYGHSVDVHASASLVRSLSGLDLYLRQNSAFDVIVIDEPEMNAHPEAQLKLVELFSMLANEGYQIIVTTHSPYFLDHLNNLIEGATLTDAQREAASSLTLLGDSRAFIDGNKVSVYLFNEEGQVKSLKDEANVIDTESFAGPSDLVNNFFWRIQEIRHEGQE